MKKLSFLLVVVFALMLLMGCLTTDAAVEVEESNDSMEEIVNHQAKAFGSDIPSWLQTIVSGSLSGLNDQYEGYNVFYNSSRGDDLDALKYWAALDVNAEVSSALSTSFNSQVAAVTNATEDEVQRVGDSLTAISSKATFNNLRKEGEYWLLWEDTDGVRTYEYYVLYTIPDVDWNNALNRILEELDEEDRVIATPVYEKIKEAGLYE